MAKKAILLVNLGSPDSYEVQDVKKYLREFLMDKRVIDYPYLFRFLLIEGIILRTRPPKSAEAYKSIWWEEGSPLIVLSKRLQEKVRQFSEIPVGLGMRYGNPSIESGLRRLKEENHDLEEVLLVPLYPHYAMSSFETVVEKAREVVKKHFPGLEVNVKNAFFGEEDYVDILKNSIQPYLEQGFDHLLFSYHGIPERHVRKSDITGSHCLQSKDCCSTSSPAHEFCYRHQTLKTTELLADKLGLEESSYSTSFQSRLGRDPWLTPFTDKTLVDLAKSGVKKLAVVCPAFVSDCLETIEEIGEEGRDLFLENGGEEFVLIPCLNDHESWAKLIASWGQTKSETTALI